MSAELKTPEFARIEIKMSGKTGLRNAANELRELAKNLDETAAGGMPDDVSDYIAWGKIKAASQRLRGTAGKEAA